MYELYSCTTRHHCSLGPFRGGQETQRKDSVYSRSCILISGELDRPALQIFSIRRVAAATLAVHLLILCLFIVKVDIADHNFTTKLITLSTAIYTVFTLE